MSSWNNAPPPPTSGSFAKFEVPGTVLEGTTTHVDPVGATTVAGAPCPLVIVEGLLTVPGSAPAAAPDGAWKVSCSQAKLWEAAVSARPEPGQGVRITFTHTEPRPGGKTLKHFTVETAGAPGAVAQQTYQTPPSAPVTAPYVQPGADSGIPGF